MKNDFYIGYLPKGPKRIIRFVIAFILVLFPVGAGTAYFLSFSYRTISNGVYEYGELTEITGRLNLKPIP